MTVLVRPLAGLLLFLPTIVLAEPLRPVRDATLTRLLNEFEMLAEVETEVLHVRVLRLRDRGECDRALESCPKEQVYVAVTTLEEMPDQRVFVLPKAYGWEFVGWKELPKRRSDTDNVAFEMKRKVIDASGPVRHWGDKAYEIRVSPTADGQLNERK